MDFSAARRASFSSSAAAAIFSSDARFSARAASWREAAFAFSRASRLSISACCWRRSFNLSSEPATSESSEARRSRVATMASKDASSPSSVAAICGTTGGVVGIVACRSGGGTGTEFVTKKSVANFGFFDGEGFCLAESLDLPLVERGDDMTNDQLGSGVGRFLESRVNRRRKRKDCPLGTRIFENNGRIVC